MSKTLFFYLILIFPCSSWLDSAKSAEEVCYFKIYFHILAFVFYQLKQISRNGQIIMQQVEDSKKPVIAAISGSCMGGGLEVWEFL